MNLLTHKDIAPIVARHAYFRTLIGELAGMVGDRGTFGSAPIRWLKPIDRTLWYVINDAGRNACIESLGVRSHFQYERVLNRAITLPVMDTAVVALEEILWRMSRVEMPQRVKDEEEARRAMAAQLLEIEARRAMPPPGR